MIDVVCAVIFDSAGRVLACKRPEGKHLAGLWEFPGGKVEAGELPSQALIREIKEELSVDIEVGSSLKSVEWSYGERKICLIPYICKVTSGFLTPSEHSDIRWCTLNSLADLEWAEADLPIIAQIQLQHRTSFMRE